MVSPKEWNVDGAFALATVRGSCCVTKLEQYRRFARACLELARNAEDKRARASLLHMAQVWHRLAGEPASDVDERRTAES